MQRLHGVGTGHDEQFIAPFQGAAAEVVGGEVLSLQVRSGCAVEYQHPLCEGVQIGVITLRTGKGSARRKDH